jgi:hypothetical protein
MAGRIRSIKPEILEDEEAASLTSDAWRLWVSMWTLADDYGNLHAAAGKLYGQVFWSRAPSITIDEMLAELVTARRIALYQVNGAQYAHVRNWEKHQRIDNAGRPRVPAPVTTGCDFAEARGDSPRTAARPPTSDLRSDHRPPTNQPTLAANSPPPVGWLDEVFARYPRKTSVNKPRAAMALAAFSDDERAAFTKAVSAYAQRVRADKTPTQFMITWAVFCEGRWREHAPNGTDHRATDKPFNASDFEADPPPKDAA